MAKRRKSRFPAAERSVDSAEVRLIRIPGIPEIRTGDDLGKVVASAARQAGIRFRDKDILVVAQKIVSKSEGALVDLAVEIVLRESRRIVRSDHVLIAETHHGFVCANAGVDHSNVPGDDIVTLLPRDPDGSAKKLATMLRKRTDKRIAVIISDTFGRPWRLGLTNVAIGAAGVPVLVDLRGTRDRQGIVLTATILAVADELAAAAGLLMDKSKGSPVVLIRGYHFKPRFEPAARIIRPAAEDLFR
jgi:coenzyme F420-0:L-glutamate ligase/coenzyme F420-1:gamma-L-glutamate ligase